MENNSILTPHELVTLRFLEQGRGTVSDGRDWLRMLLGMAITVVMGYVVATYSSKLIPEHALWLTLAECFVGLFLTTAWIMLNGDRVARSEMIRLNSKLDYSYSNCSEQKI